MKNLFKLVLLAALLLTSFGPSRSMADALDDCNRLIEQVLEAKAEMIKHDIDSDEAYQAFKTFNELKDALEAATGKLDFSVSYAQYEITDVDMLKKLHTVDDAIELLRAKLYEGDQAAQLKRREQIIKAAKALRIIVNQQVPQLEPSFTHAFAINMNQPYTEQMEIDGKSLKATAKIQFAVPVSKKKETELKARLDFDYSGKKALAGFDAVSLKNWRHNSSLAVYGFEPATDSTPEHFVVAVVTVDYP